MRLPSFRRLLEQDYDPEYQDLIRQLSVSINYGFEPLYELLNGKLTFADNTSSMISTISVTVDEKGKPKAKASIRKTSPDKFQGITVIRAVNLSNTGIYPNNTPFISYTETTDSITIDNVTGLPPDNIFQLTLFCIR